MKRTLAIAIGLVCLPSCMTVVEHKRILEKTEAKVVGERDAQVGAVKEQLARAEAAIQERDQKLAEVFATQHNNQAALDEATAINQQLRGELERLGKDVDQILKEKGTLAKALGDAKARLEELRKAQASAEARTALYADLSRRFKRMIDGKQMTIAMRDGRFVMTIPSDVLFDAGRAEIRQAGQGALLEIAKSLGSLSGRKFQVVAHTDNVPVKGKFASNLELGAARSIEVVKLLTHQGVSAAMLSAASYGDQDPLAANSTPENRERNRRIEFILQPTADEFIPVSEPATVASPPPAAAPERTKRIL